MPRSRTSLAASADCRYAGQGYELTVPMSRVSRAGLRTLRRDFDALHHAVYGHASPDQQVELVAVRLAAFGELPTPEPPPVPRGNASPPGDARVGKRRVMLPFQPRALRVPVWRRERLLAANRITGPAIVEQMDSTTVLLPGQTATIDTAGDIWIRELPRRTAR